MRPVRTILLYLILVSLVHWRAYGQVAGSRCSTPYYFANLGPSADGSLTLQSTAAGPDASEYLGCINYPTYSIVKLDSFGNVIRSTSYNPSGATNFGAAGKTIVDFDGNLFSVIFNNYILRTDTMGNVLSARQLALTSGNPNFSFVDMSMLANGDKVFLFTAAVGGYQGEFVVVTSPDASVIEWTKYFYAYSYAYAAASILADGNKVVVTAGMTGSYTLPGGSGMFVLDGGTGAILQQRWFTQLLDFNHISRYSTGYIFGGSVYTAATPTAVYVRTDTTLNVITVRNFPAYSVVWPNGYPFLFQAQADGSVYGFYSAASSMTLFQISPGDVIQWASGAAGFYQVPISLSFNPEGITIGTDWSATDGVTGGPVSGIQIYTPSYSGYFPSCAQPAAATMAMVPYALTGTTVISPIRDTSVFSTSGWTIQPTAGPTLTTSSCASFHPLTLGNDTALCAGSSMVLHAGSTFSSYTWQNGSTDSTLLVTTPGQYTVTVVDRCGNSYTSSINVSFLPALTNPLPANVTKCPDDTLSLVFPSGFDSVYFLSPAANARIWNDSIQFFASGVASYALQERDDDGCTVNSTIAVQVYPEPPILIGDDTTICPGDSVLLDAGPGFNSYEWSTGSQNQTLWAAAKGSYWVHAAAPNGCILRDTMDLAIWPAPVVNLDADTVLCTGTTLLLSAGNGFVKYLWNDGQTAAALSVSSPGQYWVTVTDAHGCSTADTVNIVEKSCLTGCYVPNAFTPNNGGKNDVFRPMIYGNVVQYTFSVFNRWGQQVFTSTELLQGWDGTIRGTPEPAGAYVWYCRYQLQGEAVQTQRGTVLLIR